MAELDELRIRLEGHLETVESVTASMVAATRALQRGRTSALAAAMTASSSAETNAALGAVQRLSSGEPALARIVERFIAARESMRAAALAYGAEVGLRALPVERVVSTLTEFPVLYRGRAIAWRSLAPGGVFLVWCMALVGLIRNPVLVLLPLSVAAGIAVVLAQSPRLVVTKGHVRLGSTVFELSDIESVLLASTLVHPRELLRVRLRGGSVVELAFSTLPVGFVEALKQVTMVEHA